MRVREKSKSLLKRECDLCGDGADLHEGRMSFVWGRFAWHCDECIEWDKASKPKVGVWATSSVASYVPSCVHHLTPFELMGGGMVWLSGRSDLKSEAQGPLPTAAVYLDTAWMREKMWANDGLATKVEGDIPTLGLTWPDFGTFDIELLVRALGWTLDKVRNGERVEVGCLGGHGRTGTFATALCVAQGVEAWEAIDYIRRVYCGKAVERREQERMVEEVDRVMNGRVAEEGDSGAMEGRLDNQGGLW